MLFWHSCATEVKWVVRKDSAWSCNQTSLNKWVINNTTDANLISPNGWGAYTAIGGYWTWQFKFRNVNRLNLLFWNLIIYYNSTQLPYCSFRKYIISRKQCEVPLSVPWNPRNQVSQHTSVWLQEESGLKQLMKHEVTTYTSGYWWERPTHLIF